MKLFLTLLCVAFPFASMAAPHAKLGRGLRGIDDVEGGDDGALTDYEIEQLFMDDIESGDMEEFMIEDFDNIDDEDDGGRKLQSSSSYVLLCKHSNCQGGHAWVPPGRYPTMPWQIGNDELTRVYIPARQTFTYYEDSWYRGWQRTYGESNSRINLYMGGHNDAVSSFIIRKF